MLHCAGVSAGRVSALPRVRAGGIIVSRNLPDARSRIVWKRRRSIAPMELCRFAAAQEHHQQRIAVTLHNDRRAGHGIHHWLSCLQERLRNTFQSPAPGFGFKKISCIIQSIVIGAGKRRITLSHDIDLASCQAAGSAGRRRVTGFTECGQKTVFCHLCCRCVSHGNRSHRRSVWTLHRMRGQAYRTAPTRRPRDAVDARRLLLTGGESSN